MKIRMQWTHFLAIVLLVIGAVACKPSQPLVDGQQSAQSQADEALANSLLWRIHGNGLEHESYLFGTIHIIQDKDYFLPKGTLSAIDDAQQMVFEVDMDDMFDISKQMGLLSDAFMKDNLTLKDLISEEEYQLVQKHFDEMGMPLFLFERFKPMFLTVFATGDMNPQDLQSGKLKSYEMEFFEIANKSGKPVSGLETLEFQMSIFDSIPYSDQAQMLVESIQLSDTDGDQYQTLVDLYKSQDINAMYESFDEEGSDLNGYEDILLVKRNKKWIPIMMEIMAENPTFFAVGAGHLGGDIGVIRLLREQGYTVTPYPSSE